MVHCETFVPTRSVTFMYTNWKGVRRQRTVYDPIIKAGNSKYHPDCKTFLVGICADKMEERWFAVSDIENFESLKI